MRVSGPKHARALAVAVAAAVALLIPQTPAFASHVGSVSITPPTGTVASGVCGPFLVRTQGGTDPIGAVVDVEVVGSNPVDFCLPASGANPVLIDPSTGDLGNGTDGTVGGEATADAYPVPNEGAFTFGVLSSTNSSYEITVFVEEPGGPNDNDDPDPGEPQGSASLTVGSGGTGSGGNGTPAKVDSTITLTRNFRGTVQSSVPACESGRKVVVKRVRKGPDRVVGSDRTSDSGAYRIPTRGKTGRFYAIAKKKNIVASGATCMRAQSKRVSRARH